jgi:hypothetical protein
MQEPGELARVGTQVPVIALGKKEEVMISQAAG